MLTELDLPIWLGGSDLETEGQWKWASTENEVSRDPYFWKSDQPDNGDREEHCLEMHPYGEWNDEKCSDRQISVCEFINIL